MSFPIHRLRRLRRFETIRTMVRETILSPSDFVLPMFITHGHNIRREIASLPGNFHLSIDRCVEEATHAKELGIPAILIFGIPQQKDEQASEAWAADGIVQQAVRAVKKATPDLVVITDACLCEYTPHGNCGIIKEGYLENDSSLDLLMKTALSQAEAGADMVAPAAMLDGEVAGIRNILDEHGFQSTAIMGYSSKFASCLYDPFFKEGTGGVLTGGDKKSHQMDFGNTREAMREIERDIEEGADIVMVKPGLWYLDIVFQARQRFDVPLAVYNVSGEYAMIQAAGRQGILNTKSLMIESLTAIKRAGADIIITYFAKEAAIYLKNK